MKFQIVNPEGECVMVTEHAECLYDKETISDMNSAGYKFRIEGKLVPVAKFKEYLSGKPITSNKSDIVTEDTDSLVSGTSKNNLKSSFFHTTDKSNTSEPTSSSKVTVSSAKTKLKLKLRCLETGDIFNKQAEAAKKYGIDPAAVSDSLKTGRKRAGYTFEWVGA